MTAPEVLIINPNLHPDLVVYPAAGTRLVEGSVLTAERQELRLGAGAYTGSMLANLGCRVSLVDSVGSDIFGQFTITELERLGLDTSLVSRYEGDHMVVVSVADEESAGGTMIRHCADRLAATDDRTGCGSRASASRGRGLRVVVVLVVLQPRASRGPDRATPRVVRDKAGLVLLDPNWKPHDPPPRHEVAQLVDALASVDVLKLNETDARVIAGDAEPAVAARMLVAMGPSIVVLTLGERGCIVADEKRPGAVALPTVDGRPRDTTGAGDYFGGALLHTLLRGADAVDAAAFALAAAGLAIGQPASAPLPQADVIAAEAATIARRAAAA